MQITNKNFHEEDFILCFYVDTCLTYKSELTELFTDLRSVHTSFRETRYKVDSHIHTITTTAKKRKTATYARIHKQKGQDIEPNTNQRNANSFERIFCFRHSIQAKSVSNSDSSLKKLYIYICTHTHTHTVDWWCMLQRRTTFEFSPFLSRWFAFYSVFMIIQEELILLNTFAFAFVYIQETWIDVNVYDCNHYYNCELS